jgi:hypothetical protein
MSQKPRLSAAQEIASELLDALNVCAVDSTDLKGNDLLNIYRHPDFDTAAIGREIKKEDLSGEQLDALYEEYHSKYGHDELCLTSANSKKFITQIDYMKALLKGIVDGHITTGDGNLGQMLLEFSSELLNTASKAVNSSILNRDNPKAAMPQGLSELYKKHFEGMLQNIYKGAETGLFTSGHPIIEPMRDHSMVAKYGSRNTDKAIEV